LASRFKDVCIDDIGSLVQPFKRRSGSRCQHLWLGGAYIFVVFVKVAFDECNLLGYVFSHKFGSEAWPCGEVSSFDRLEEGECGRTGAGSM
jgi:hypothetical protein